MARNRACDICKQKRVGCKGNGVDECMRCSEKKLHCTYTAIAAPGRKMKILSTPIRDVSEGPELLRREVENLYEGLRTGALVEVCIERVKKIQSDVRKVQHIDPTLVTVISVRTRLATVSLYLNDPMLALRLAEETVKIAERMKSAESIVCKQAYFQARLSLSRLQRRNEYTAQAMKTYKSILGELELNACADLISEHASAINSYVNLRLSQNEDCFDCASLIETFINDSTLTTRKRAILCLTMARMQEYINPCDSFQWMSKAINDFGTIHDVLGYVEASIELCRMRRTWCCIGTENVEISLKPGLLKNLYVNLKDLQGLLRVGLHERQFALLHLELSLLHRHICELDTNPEWAKSEADEWRNSLRQRAHLLFKPESERLEAAFSLSI